VIGAAMTIIMFDLAGADDDRRISPFCWRARMALAHKGLQVETRPWRMVEKERIAASGLSTVPVIVDGGRMIGDSWAIADYLDDAYADRPLLFEGPQSRALTRFLHHWTERVLHRLLVPLILRDVVAHLHEKDLAFFRRTREQAFGRPLEAVMDESLEAAERFAAALGPVRGMLRDSPFLAGARPAFADYIVFGAFQWARSCSPRRLVRDEQDPLHGWLARMSDLFGGLAALAPGYVSWSVAGGGGAQNQRRSST
jgi:glutathione S-transferase